MVILAFLEDSSREELFAGCCRQCRIRMNAHWTREVHLSDDYCGVTSLRGKTFSLLRGD